MDELTIENQKLLKLLHERIDKYRIDPTLCANLSPNDCEYLGELQAIFLKLTQRNVSTQQTMFGGECKGITDAMQRSINKYQTIDSQQLFENYKNVYRTARANSTELSTLSNI